MYGNKLPVSQDPQDSSDDKVRTKSTAPEVHGTIVAFSVFGERSLKEGLPAEKDRSRLASQLCNSFF